MLIVYFTQNNSTNEVLMIYSETREPTCLSDFSSEDKGGTFLPGVDSHVHGVKIQITMNSV